MMADASVPLVRDASSLFAIAVEVMAESHTTGARARELVGQVHARLAERRDLVDESRTLRGRLKNAVEALAHQQRMAGAPPEKMICLLKDLVFEAKIEKHYELRRSLMSDVVRWGIEAYYAA